MGEGLQRPECILAEPDGTLWAADARGGVVRIRPDGTQQIVTQKRSATLRGRGQRGDALPDGTLPNGLAFAADGDIPDLELRHGLPRDHDARRRDARAGRQHRRRADRQGQLRAARFARIASGSPSRRASGTGCTRCAPILPTATSRATKTAAFRIVADGFRFTNEIRFDAREEFLYVVETTGGCISRLRVDDDGALSGARGLRAVDAGHRARGPTASPSTASAICGAPWSTRTNCSC